MNFYLSRTTAERWHDVHPCGVHDVYFALSFAKYIKTSRTMARCFWYSRRARRVKKTPQCGVFSQSGAGSVIAPWRGEAVNPWVRFPKGGASKDNPAGIPVCTGLPAEKASQPFHFAVAKRLLCKRLPIRFPPLVRKKRSREDCAFGTPGGNRTHNCPLGGGCYIHLTTEAYG